MERTSEELREVEAQIAVTLFGWRWFARDHYEGGKAVAIFPPENDPLGFERTNWNPDWWVDVTGNEAEHRRLHDWYKGGWRENPKYSTLVRVVGQYLPEYATNPEWFFVLWKRLTDEGLTIQMHEDGKNGRAFIRLTEGKHGDAYDDIEKCRYVGVFHLGATQQERLCDAALSWMESKARRGAEQTEVTA